MGRGNKSSGRHKNANPTGPVRKTPGIFAKPTAGGKDKMVTTRSKPMNRELPLGGVPFLIALPLGCRRGPISVDGAREGNFFFMPQGWHDFFWSSMCR